MVPLTLSGAQLWAFESRTDLEDTHLVHMFTVSFTAFLQGLAI